MNRKKDYFHHNHGIVQKKIFYRGVLGVFGLPRWCSGTEITCQAKRRRRGRVDPWLGKIPWSQKWQPTLVFLPGESHGQRSLAG